MSQNSLFFLLVLLFSVSLVVTQTLIVRDPDVQVESVPKLKVQIYYEALCPYCQKFFTDQLQPSMRTKGRFNYTNLQLVPYGNAKIVKNETTHKFDVVCQHGSDECVFNAGHACILENAEFGQAFDVISCLMGANTQSECAEKFKFDLNIMRDCMSKRSIYEILKKYADETAKVHQTGVPYVVMDGKNNPDDDERLISGFDKAFCELYKSKYGKTLDGC